MSSRSPGNKNINDFIKRLSKKFGDSDAIRIGSATFSIPSISTGSIILDEAIGGGIYKNRITEIYGLEGSGKTTLCLGITREVQQSHPNNFVVYIDVECALTDSLIRMNGVDPERLITIQPKKGEDVFDYAIAWCKFNQEQDSTTRVPLIVVDSIAAIVPVMELDNSMHSQQVGSQARLISKGLRKILGDLKSSDTALIFTNQIRSKVGVIYGSPETTSGGHSMRFYASLRLRIKKIKLVENSDIAHQMEVRITKNKFTNIKAPVSLEIIEGIGYDKCSEIITMAISKSILRSRGSWIYEGDRQIAQGRKKAIEFYKNNTDEYKRLFNIVHNTPKEARANQKIKQNIAQMASAAQSAAQIAPAAQGAAQIASAKQGMAQIASAKQDMAQIASAAQSASQMESTEHDMAQMASAAQSAAQMPSTKKLKTIKVR